VKRGRPKGYSPYVDTTYEELGNYLGPKGVVKVSRAWLESLNEASNQTYTVAEILVASIKDKRKEQEKIEYKLTDLNNEK
jgi:hypothetical protein